MNARAASCVLLLAALGLPMFAAPSVAGPWSLAKGEYASELGASVYSSVSFQTPEGDRFPLGYRFESRDFRSTNQFGWKKSTNFILEMKGRSLSFADGSSRFTGNQTGLSELTLGFHRNLMNGRQGAALEVLWTAPLGYDRELSSLGDGRQRLAANLAVGTALAQRGFAQASVGYFFRYQSFTKADSLAMLMNTDRSSAHFVTLSADAGAWIRPRVMLGASYAGQSVISSTLPEPLDKDWELDASRHLVGPFVLLRVDDRLDMKAGTLSVASGKSTLHFDQFWIALAFKQTKLNRLQGFLGGAH